MLGESTKVFVLTFKQRGGKTQVAYINIYFF